MRGVFLIAALLSGPALACPTVDDRSAETDALIARLQDAPDVQAAQRLGAGLWEIWTDAPDDRSQAMLDRGMAQIQSYDFAGSIDTLDGLVAYCPDYAEGWNQRAFAKYLSRDFEAALSDLDRALDLSPRHVAAMSGKALTLLGLGRDAEGQQVLRDALALNPWLSERRYLSEPPGEDI